MSKSKTNFGAKPYSRKTFGELSNFVQRGYADSFSGSPSQLREASIEFNPRPVCYFCGTLSSNGEFTNPTDHIYPVALGGISVPGNFGYICQECNSAKGALHPLIYWRRRQSNGQALWIKVEALFLAWLEDATSAYRQSHPRHYEVSSRIDQTVEDRQFLIQQWRDWYLAQTPDLSSEDFWFSEGKIARAEAFKHYLPTLFPTHETVSIGTQRCNMTHLGLLVELFGSDSELVLNGEYSEESFREISEANISHLIRDHGGKNRQVEKYLKLHNAVLERCYKVELSAKERRLTKKLIAEATDPIEQAMERCRIENSALIPESTRLKRRLTLTKGMAEKKLEEGSSAADIYFSEIYWLKSKTEKCDMRFAARAAGVKIEPVGVTPLMFES